MNWKVVSWIGITFVALGATLCQAQEKRDRRERRPREDRPQRLREMGLADSKSLLEQMKEELKLTEGQETEAKRLIEAYDLSLKEIQKSAHPSDDQIKRLTDMRDQIQEARKNNDQARLQQLLEEMRGFRKQDDERQAPLRAQIESSTKTLHDQLAALITQERQKATFEAIWEDAMAGKRGGRGRVGDNPRMLRSIVSRLPDITKEQREQIDGLYKDYEKTSRDGARRAEQVKAGRKFHDDVIALLTPEQKSKLEAEIKKRDGRTARAGDEKKTP